MDDKKLDQLKQEYESLLEEYRNIQPNVDHQTPKTLTIHNELMKKHQAITKLLPQKTDA